ncbi:MAG: hypothetical protein HY327_08870 [Chloroflexi bacterium]|nr:hypothetical protein [Chloroflexota bacterium]
MLDPVSTAILQSIQYADLFDYPLTPDEIHRYLIGMRAPTARRIRARAARKRITAMPNANRDAMSVTG